MLLPILALFVGAQGPGAAPFDASKLAASAPTTVAELDLGKLKGRPSRLAWSPEGNELYLQTRDGDDPERARVRHYVIALDGKGSRAADDEPQWASQYWTWKSGQSAPGGPPSLKIEVRREERLQSSTATPMGGDLARGVPSGGTGGVSVGEVTSARQQTQKVIVTSLWLKGERLGEWVNAAVLPGQTFGWAPHGCDAIAFVNRNGEVVIMDAQGRKHPVPETAGVLFPAWRDDGARLAFLERAGRKKILLKTIDVSTP
jgi:hypothetical protein